jgi:hypothetical protein
MMKKEIQSMKRHIFVIVFLAASLSGSELARSEEPRAQDAAGDDSFMIPPDLVERYPAARWIGMGRVQAEHELVAGRLILPAGAKVASRASLEEDGSFATQVFLGRTLIFYAHGYDPLVVGQGVLVAPRLRDVGDLFFTQTPPEHLRSCIGAVDLEGPSPTEPVQIKALLRINNDAYLFNDHSHGGGKTSLSVTVETQSLNSSDVFSFKDLSPIPYEVVVEAPGYITRRITIQPNARGQITLAPITLAAAPVIDFTYAVDLDLKAEADWTLTKPQHQKVICNGVDEFCYRKRVEEVHAIQLRLRPVNAGVQASFCVNPCEFYDLGPGVLSTFLDNREWVARLPGLTPANDLMLKPGHVYFFQNTYSNVWTTNCLFAVAPAAASQ